MPNQSIRRVKRAVNSLKQGREKKSEVYTGLLGILSDGNQVVEVPGRPGFVWVRLRNSFSEVSQAFNDSVAPVYNLPVRVQRDPSRPTRYRIVGRDVGRFANWGTSSPYLGTHGFTHAYGAGGGDVVWVDSQQITRFMVQPSGTAGSLYLTVNQGVYFYSNAFHHAGDTGTASLLSYLPTGSSAKMVLVYLDKSTGNFGIEDGTSFFSSSITATSQLVEHIPNVPAAFDVPLAAVRLISGTTALVWANLIDVRPWFGID